MNPSEKEEEICIRLFINEYKGFIGVKNLCSQKFYLLPCAKDPEEKNRALLSIQSILFVCFWDFTRKIPNSGIRADLGSLKVSKKFKGGFFVAAVNLLQQSEVSGKRIQVFLKVFFVLLLKKQPVF